MSVSSNFPLAYQRRHVKKAPKATTVQIIKQSLKTVGKEYCAESSIGGLKHLVNENTSYLERITWIITLILGLACSIVLVNITFSKYYRAPLVTTQFSEGISTKEIIFPAVGICTNNRISRRAVTELAHTLLKEERNKKYNETEMLSLLFGLRQLYDYRLKTAHIADPIVLHRILGDYDVNELLKNLTPRCEDILLSCVWNEILKKCTQLFDFRLTANGYCCTFNYLRQSDIFEENSESHINMYNFGNKSSFDYDKGLKFLMRLNESDDFYYHIPIIGARLQFSHAYDFPDSPSGSFSTHIVSPGIQMSVRVSSSVTLASPDIRHLPLGVRGCLFYDESSYLSLYTTSDCLLKCRMLYLQEKCHCAPYNMPKQPNSRTCDLTDMQCLRLYHVQSINQRPKLDTIPEELELDLVGGGISCPMCYPTCEKTAFKFQCDNVKMYPDQLNALPDIDRLEWIRGVNFTGTSIVHVKYNSAISPCYNRSVIMQWFDLISDIGSTCGFVTGFSFVSVLEFVYFFTVKLVREVRTRRRLRQQNRSNVVQRPNPALLQPITRYTPIYWNELAGSNLIGQNTHSKRWT